MTAATQLIRTRARRAITELDRARTAVDRVADDGPSIVRRAEEACLDPRREPAGASTTSDGTRFAQGSGEIREHESLPPFQRDPARLASIAERRAAKQAAEDTRRPTEGDPAS